MTDATSHGRTANHCAKEHEGKVADISSTLKAKRRPSLLQLNRLPYDRIAVPAEKPRQVSIMLVGRLMCCPTSVAVRFPRIPTSPRMRLVIAELLSGFATSQQCVLKRLSGMAIPHPMLPSIFHSSP